MSPDLGKFLRGETSAEAFARALIEYYDSPEWRRRKAEIASDRLKRGKAGRETLFGLIDEAEKEGWRVSWEFVPLGTGDSVLLTVAGTTLGYPDWMPPEVVESHFREQMGRARRAGAPERRIDDRGKEER